MKTKEFTRTTTITEKKNQIGLYKIEIENGHVVILSSKTPFTSSGRDNSCLLCRHTHIQLTKPPTHQLLSKE